MTRKVKKCSAVAWFICVCAAIVITPALATAQATETVLHSFETLPKGSGGSALIRDEAGNLYGTGSGGRWGAGVVYTLDTTGHETVLYAFTGGADGNGPYSVILDSAGSLYGTTQYGGVGGCYANLGCGVVYKLDTVGHETVLYSFMGGADGGSPSASVIRDAAGNLYGTTSVGGTANLGVVFKVDPAGQETVLYSFMGGADGQGPSGGLVRDSVGNLYGTAFDVVYKLDPAGHETVLYTFATLFNPYLSGLTSDSAGNLYGTAADISGGVSSSVFKVDLSGNVIILNLLQDYLDQAQPNGVIPDAAGNLYGTTVGGGGLGKGMIFKVNPAGKVTVLHSFKGGRTDGADPNAGLIGDTADHLYGTTTSGGSTNVGVVYQVDTTGQETVLYSFSRGFDGIAPQAGVIGDAAGNLYGTASGGGLAFFGVVYKLDVKGRETVLHTFTGGADGANPNSGVILDGAGNLHGTLSSGGPANAGVIYTLDSTGRKTVLHSFGGPDGAVPYAGVIRDSAGNLFGTTSKGGTANAGVVYKLDAAGAYTVLHNFTGTADGGIPYAGVILDSAGNLYGTTTAGGAANAGVVYKLDAAGHETVLYSFMGGADGGDPYYAGVILDSAGNLYGTTVNGGTLGPWGVVYKLDTAGRLTVLHTFTGGTDGGLPYAGVIRDAAGDLYGTTDGGGPAHVGVVYKLDAAGQFSVLYSFSGVDGSQPQAGLIRDSAGNLYGTTYSGGRTRSGGTIFRIKPQ
jgi:uncharacterized repeat protein (TIGR03803 family)